MTRTAMSICATILGLGAALLSGPMLDAASAQGRSTSIAIGETRAPGALGRVLREALRDELDSVAGVRVTNARRARYVLRGSITHIDERRESGRMECEVSLVLADRRGGNIRLILEGRAAARLPRRDEAVARLRPELLRAAVRGALRPLGEQPLR